MEGEGWSSDVSVMFVMGVELYGGWEDVSGGGELVVVGDGGLVDVVGVYNWGDCEGLVEFE